MGTGYRAENTDLFPQMKTSGKVHICLYCWIECYSIPLNVVLVVVVVLCKAMHLHYQLLHSGVAIIVNRDDRICCAINFIKSTRNSIWQNA